MAKKLEIIAAAVGPGGNAGVGRDASGHYYVVARTAKGEGVLPCESRLGALSHYGDLVRAAGLGMLDLGN